MLFPIILAGRDDDTNDDLTDEHVNTSNKSERAATDLVDDEDGGDGSCDIDDTSDPSSQQGGSAACKTETLEDDGSVVNDCERRGQRMQFATTIWQSELTRVDTSPLLEEHHQGTQRDTLERVLAAENVRVLRNLALEDALVVTSKRRKTLCESTPLENDFRLDLEVFNLHQDMLFRKTT